MSSGGNKDIFNISQIFKIWESVGVDVYQSFKAREIKRFKVLIFWKYFRETPSNFENNVFSTFWTILRDLKGVFAKNERGTDIELNSILFATNLTSIYLKGKFLKSEHVWNPKT